MANFFTDNQDIQFLFEHMDPARLAGIMEDGFKYAEQFDHAPADAADAVDNYRRILEALGELAAEQIAPTAEETDLLGNTRTSPPPPRRPTCSATRSTRTGRSATPPASPRRSSCWPRPI